MSRKFLAPTVFLRAPRRWGGAICVTAMLTLWLAPEAASDPVVKYVRFAHDGGTAYGILKDGTVGELDGNPFDAPQLTKRVFELSKVRLLPPTVPSKVIAVGLNYQSHGGGRGGRPGLFAKFPSSLVGHDGTIQYSADTSNLHYEGELVIVIGKRARNVTAKDAPAYVFGVTAGNDVSERSWQFSDLQWVRAKGSDSFGPVGPALVTGLEYNDLRIETRLNGEVRQSESTKNMIHSVADLVSYISRYLTLLPGDLIFSGTPGATAPMRPGDVVEVEIEGVGILRNRVVATE